MFLRSILLITLFFQCFNGFAQDKSRITVTGIVTDVHDNPIKGALFFVDYQQIKHKTNRKGTFKIKLKPEQTVSVYAPSLGLISKEIERPIKIRFKFPEDSGPLSKEELIKLGFKFNKDVRNNTDWYADFSNILDILDKRFYNVRIINGEIIIGKGANTFNGDRSPLILLDGRPIDVDGLGTIATTDIKLIKVISSGSEASQYGGLRSANGVILITLKQ